jgi:hypothetical protein
MRPSIRGSTAVQEQPKQKIKKTLPKTTEPHTLNKKRLIEKNIMIF